VPREFDSYDPFGGTAEGNFLGDGVIARVLRNDEQIWPLKDWLHKKWQYIPNADAKVPLDAEVEVLTGDRLVFVINRFGTIGHDLNAFDPTMSVPMARPTELRKSSVASKARMAGVTNSPKLAGSAILTWLDLTRRDPQHINQIHPFNWATWSMTMPANSAKVGCTETGRIHLSNKCPEGALQFRQQRAILKGTEQRSPSLINSTSRPVSMPSLLISCARMRPCGAVFRPLTMC
jgi:hypothetical protein